MRDLTGLVKKSRKVVTETYPDARIKQIVDTILYADARGSAFTVRLAPQLVGRDDMETLKNIWSFVRKNVRYRRDRAGKELVKSPGATIADGYGDCKSMSIFVGALLRNLGYTYFYRVARYDPKYPEQGHIYPIAVLPDGTRVVVDAVNAKFNSEYEYWRKADYQPRAGGDTAISGVTPATGFKRSWPWLVLLGFLTLKTRS